MNKADLLRELDKSRAEMLLVLGLADRGRDIYPGWTIRQVLAHLTGWDEAVTASLRAFLEGSDAAIASYRGINEYNARSVETRADLSHEQTRREWEVARTELCAALEAIPESHLDTEMTYPWGARGSLRGLIGVIYSHEEEHAEEIRGLLRKGDSPSGV
ncbi:MAG: maleylpyruvate isomerase N-terminal domain-containing protein [Anaerolineae bacterium]|nr:maleylpyruvate isomerase N-terminal domain-containing protein [Anaerolineae bacterium]